MANRNFDTADLNFETTNLNFEAANPSFETANQNCGTTFPNNAMTPQVIGAQPFSPSGSDRHSHTVAAHSLKPRAQATV
jgi:hypothetical protein